MPAYREAIASTAAPKAAEPGAPALMDVGPELELSVVTAERLWATVVRRTVVARAVVLVRVEERLTCRCLWARVTAGAAGWVARLGIVLALGLALTSVLLGRTETVLVVAWARSRRDRANREAESGSASKAPGTPDASVEVTPVPELVTVVEVGGVTGGLLTAAALACMLSEATRPPDTTMTAPTLATGPALAAR